MKLPKNVGIERVEVVFSQPEDSDGRVGEDAQTLIVTTRDAGAGPYLVIQTERWAIDHPKDIAALLGLVYEMMGTKVKP